MVKVLELFAGIGACSKALERLGIEHEIVDAVEIDKYAIESFNGIHRTSFGVQDICKWDKEIEVDLIMHGSPCQDFSVAGKQLGGDKGTGTRSSLMYETLRIVRKLKPKYVVWENVKNLLSNKHRHNFDNYIKQMEELGYNSYYKVLNSKDYGIPQNRERVFTISIRKDIDKGYNFPEKEELKLRLKDMLEEKVDEKYYLNDAQIDNIKFSNFMQEKKRIQEKEYCDTLLTRNFKDSKCVQVGNLQGEKWEKIHESCRRVYAESGISPTIPTCQGGNTEPKVMRVGRIFNTEENTHQASIMIKNATKQGYLEAKDGDGVYTNTSNKRGTVQKGMAQTLTGFQDKGVVIDSKDNSIYNSNLQIRKLTPLECWRLQGFEDEDFYKAKERLNSVFYKGKDKSNSQLYKQAGNSITVNVLEKILEKIFK